MIKSYLINLFCLANLSSVAGNAIQMKIQYIYFDTNLLQFATRMLEPGFGGAVEAFNDTFDMKLKKLNISHKLREDWRALLFILATDDQLPFIFTTSKLTLKETQKAPRAVKGEMLAFYETLVNYGDPHKWGSRLTVPPPPKKGTLELLRRFLPDKNDAKHVYYSLLKRCNMFLTCDYNSILKYRKKLREFNVNAKSPHELVVEIYGEDLWKRGAGLLLQP